MNEDKMRVIVAGSRTMTNFEYMTELLNQLFRQEPFAGKDITIVSGRAKGADLLGEQYADDHQLTKILFPANWAKHGRKAGFRRNEDMLTIANAVIAFWDGQSHGTQHMIEIAKEAGLPTFVFGLTNITD